MNKVFKMRRILTASDGCYYTDGNVYGKIVYLANNANIDDFYEITEEEYEKRFPIIEDEAA